MSYPQGVQTYNLHSPWKRVIKTILRILKVKQNNKYTIKNALEEWPLKYLPYIFIPVLNNLNQVIQIKSSPGVLYRNASKLNTNHFILHIFSYLNIPLLNLASGPPAEHTIVEDVQLRVLQDD